MICSNVADYREAARRSLPGFAYHYLEGGAEDEITMARNRTAFQRIGFEPRVLVNVDAIDTHTTLAGAPAAWPAVVGPTGLNGLYWPRAEETLAQAAHAAGLPFALSTASTSLIEDVRRASDGELWLQLYVQQDRRIAENMMARARANGFTTLLLTVDTPVAGQRDHYARTGFALPLRWTPRLLWDVATHPRWAARVGRHGVPQLVNIAKSADIGPGIEAQAAALSRQMDRSLEWDDLAWLRRNWPGKILIKGVQSVDDAMRASQHDVDGVVLSNHGGRQLDGAPSAMEVLAEARGSMRRGFDLFIDGGVRRGSDIVKAVALGARGVLLGRAPLYGLAGHGRKGVDHVLALLYNELQICLRLIGCARIDALDASRLRLYETTVGTPAPDPARGSKRPAGARASPRGFDGQTT
ncbi:alpha-hydroxy-acid oxidizing protein [Trinickia terrae]|uniref:Alpha-hydroxy-acid oxidizing protein n=1 Tax=Trinickia terrae TaxID=2571161 RepID=A0A4U1I5V2_9BURK|nr:alpha-hydroxy acid oxidase [Trinickia terrae]TKC88734.1 alpha-hydroxy-acid oxidizing protein [Trinickia terrae]